MIHFPYPDARCRMRRESAIASWGAPVIRISLAYIFNLANQIEPLSRLPTAETPYRAVSNQLLSAEWALRAFNQSIYYPYLRTCHELGHKLLTALSEETSQPDDGRSLNPFGLFLLREAYSDYKIAFLAAVGTLDSYFVTQKGGFDTMSLLEFGENLFPNDLAAKVPEAITDVREAARCLAYERPTAAGFHVFRATESVLRKYHSHVTGGSASPKVRNIGVYLNSLKTAGKGNPKVLAALKQMTDLHRSRLSIACANPHFADCAIRTAHRTPRTI